MNCMKCGREAEADQLFCESCLEEMENYPVKPETVVLLPKRPASVGFKKVHQRRQTPEEQIAKLEKRCRRLVAALLVSWFLLAGAGVAVGITVYEMDMHRFLGQNYTSSDETEPPVTGSVG